MRRAMTGRAGRERLDGDQAEWLRPAAGHERRVAVGEQLVTIGLGELAQELDILPGRLERRLRRRIRSRRAPDRTARSWPRSADDDRTAARSRSRRRCPSRAPRDPRSRARRSDAGRTGTPADPARCGRSAAHGTSGCVDAWFWLIATSGPGAPSSRAVAQGRSSRPWNVETTGIGLRLASSETRPLEVRVDQVELVDPAQDLMHREVEPRAACRRCSPPGEGLRGRWRSGGRGHRSRPMRTS